MSILPSTPVPPLTTAQINELEYFTPMEITDLDQFTITSTSITNVALGPNNISYDTNSTLSIDNLDQITIRVRNNKKYVIAGNYKEYKYFIDKKKFNPEEYVYVNDADSLRGLHDIHGYYVGTWRSRQDIDSIKLNIEMANIK